MSDASNAAPDPTKNIQPGTGVLWRLLSLFNMTRHPFGLSPDDIGGDVRGKQLQEWWKDQFEMPGVNDRKQRTEIFKQMASFDLVGAILDVYAEEATQKDYDRGRAIWVESPTARMVTAGDACLRNIKAEDRASAVVRSMAQMGDVFRRLIYKTGRGVLGWKHMSVDKTFRVEDKYDRLIGFKADGQTFRGTKAYPVSWPWDVVHFRLLGKDEHTMYGTSALESMFRSWRQMTLGEDSMLMYRLRRAPDRNLIFIDVGSMEEHEAMNFVNAWRKRFRKHEFIDPATPEYRKQYNPLTPLEDIFWPVRGAENNSRVESLAGAGNVGDIVDIEFFRDKFFGAAKTPKAYFGFEGEINAKATLMQQDVRFARTIKRMQRAAIYGFRQVLDIHFTLLATEHNDEQYNPEKNKYLVQMSPVSYLDEWERLELLQLRHQIVDGMSQWAQTLSLNPRIWATYILLNYAKLPEDLVLKLISKAPEEPVPMEGGGGGFEAQSDADMWKTLRAKGGIKLIDDDGTLHRLTEEERSAAKGFYPLSKSEEVMIGRLMHTDPKLRQIVSNFAEVSMDDLIEQQTDPSVLPPQYPNPSFTDQTDPEKIQLILLEDGYTNDPEAKMLDVHMKELLEGG